MQLPTKLLTRNQVISSAGLLREWVMGRYGLLWFFATGYRQTVAKLLVIWSPSLHGVQVVAGSNPVAPTTDFIVRPPGCLAEQRRFFSFSITNVGILRDSSPQTLFDTAIRLASSARE
jgi:hypothetical protein